MIMLFSVATGYALRALAALPEDGSFSLTKELSENLDLPKPYLSKILGALAHEGLLESVRGRGGGFRLAFPADRIAVGDVVRVLEGSERGTCAMGAASCDGNCGPCPFHETWMAVKAQLDWLLATVTISDLRAWEPQGGVNPKAEAGPKRAPAGAASRLAWLRPGMGFGAPATVHLSRSAL
jgi:Rrf2 family protein